MTKDGSHLWDQILQMVESGRRRMKAMISKFCKSWKLMASLVLEISSIKLE